MWCGLDWSDAPCMVSFDGWGACLPREPCVWWSRNTDIRTVTDKTPVCVFTSLCLCNIRPTARPDQNGGAKSILLEQRWLFPAHHSALLLHLDWRVCQHHREEQGQSFFESAIHKIKPLGNTVNSNLLTVDFWFEWKGNWPQIWQWLNKPLSSVWWSCLYLSTKF